MNGDTRNPLSQLNKLKLTLGCKGPSTLIGRSDPMELEFLHAQASNMPDRQRLWLGRQGGRATLSSRNTPMWTDDPYARSQD
jgi:hypothetical protein